MARALDCEAKLLESVDQASCDVVANITMPATSIVDEERMADKMA